MRATFTKQGRNKISRTKSSKIMQRVAKLGEGRPQTSTETLPKKKSGGEDIPKKRRTTSKRWTVQNPRGGRAIRLQIPKTKNTLIVNRCLTNLSLEEKLCFKKLRKYTRNIFLPKTATST